MKSAEAYRTVCRLLSEAGIEDAGVEADLLLRHVTGKGRFDVDFLTDEQWQNLRVMAAKRAQRYPLQYLLGSWPFMGLELLVGPGVLIPRQETELVCAAAIECVQDVAAPRVLDLCAGSGALALGIAQTVPNAHIAAVELSDKAFVWLQKNVKAYAEKYANPPEVVQADVLTYFRELDNSSVDLIVSNPPYVTETEYAKLAPELYHEPKEALIAPENGLAFYKAIAQNYKEMLKHGGWLVFELGAEQGEQVAALLQQSGYSNVIVQQDYSQNDRIAKGQKA